jgi:hypothetical protein
MKPIKMYYTVWYYREGWGTSYATVKARDVVEAIALVRAPLAEKLRQRFRVVRHLGDGQASRRIGDLTASRPTVIIEVLFNNL